MDTLLSNPWRTLSKHANDDGVDLPSGVEALPTLPAGPFVRLSDNTIAGRKGDRVCLSTDGGAHWEEGTRFAGDNYEMAPDGAIGAAGDTLVFAFADRSRKSKPSWAWENLWGTTPPAELPCCLARSPDGGKTWEPVRTLHKDWTGSVRDMIQTRTGRLVMTSMKILYQPVRHGCMTYWSDDQGATWQASNMIDYGGIGHHDGALEPSIVELNDGSIYMLIRTNWHQFWYAKSWDDGAHWHTMGPTGLDASSAPGLLLRLQSGRIALVWNRLYPSDGTSTKWRIGGDMQLSATATNNFREELSIAFSEDECQTWSPSRVIARKPGGELAYPYVFEPQPGVLWVTTQPNFGDLRLALSEEAFL